MSRTIRRRRAHQADSYIPTIAQVDRWDLHRTGAPTAEACVERLRARFHRDWHPGRWGVPRWYVHTLNRVHKRADEAELRRCWNKACWEDHTAVPFLRNAGYTWW